MVLNKTTTEYIYVAAGEFRISNAEKLNAILGCCVGVALYDRTAEIGGLIHLPLAEPYGSYPEESKFAYASTGLPAFIHELLIRGAEKNRLEAVVAGGALTAPISQRDLNLDLGGRTTDKVLEILHQENIPITQLDTGGYNGCTFYLNTGTWQTEIRPSIPDMGSSEDTVHKPSALDVELAIQKLRPIPQVALKVIRLIQQHEYSMSQLAKEIRSDQVVCARILQFCNSPIARISEKPIDSIDRALTLFGERNLFELLIASTVNIYFLDQIGGYSLRRGGLFFHAMCVAGTAKKIAEYVDGIAPEVAYTAGLIHDIGKVVLDQFVIACQPLFYKDMALHEQSFTELEQTVFGTDHLAVGRQLAVLWSLPENLIEAIALHNQPEKATIAPDLVYIIHLANLLSTWYQADQLLEHLDAERFLDCLEILGLQQVQLSDIVTFICRLGGKPLLE